MITNKLTKQLALVEGARTKIEEALAKWNDYIAIADDSIADIPSSLTATQDMLNKEKSKIELRLHKHQHRFDNVRGVLTAVIVGTSGLTKRVACISPHKDIDEPSIPESFYTTLQKCLKSTELWTTENFPVYVTSRSGSIIKVIESRG
jgi:hypothetical protein